MERLWTPWRMAYVSGRSRSGCVFCIDADSGHDVETLVLHRGNGAYLILNLYPYNSGHLMVVPYEHVSSPEIVDAAVRHELSDLAMLAMGAARRVLRCDGFNMGMNVGEIAGAGVADHIHLHIVPRWTGDANFMPILGNTMVLPELLPVTYARLRAEIETAVASRDERVVPQAGAVVVVPEQQAVVLRRSSTGEIVLPKGHIEEGESAAEAAMREVREETGIDAVPAGWAGSSTFDLIKSSGRTERRFVSYLIGVGTMTGEIRAHLDVDTLLAPIDSAADTVTIPELAGMIRSVTPTLRVLMGSTS